MHVYIGTYAKPDAPGIFHLLLDPATGKLTAAKPASGIENPSFVAVAPNHKFLYSVAEVDTFKGAKGGGVVGFAIDPKTGDLTKLNEQATGGASTCHVTVDHTSHCVMVASYSGGSIAACTINAQGELSPRTAFIQHTGSSVDKGRQEGPHAHSIYPSPDNRFALSCDLGLDKILVYKLDPVKGTLTPNDPPSVSVKPGSGPRHFAFHPSGKFGYLITEMGQTVIAFSYNADKGSLTELQTLSTVASPHKGNSCAEIYCHPNGKFVYGSNRGADNIAIFKIDQLTGKLTAIGHQGSGIKEPRGFGIDPTGRWMLVASQNGDNVQVFSIDGETGALLPTGEKVSVPKPVCVEFLNMAQQ
ncbi:MAG TPA: lactonase family protein [Pirellulales bacterium]|nr:lactonase family protein [Pirellulales bacterium]